MKRRNHNRLLPALLGILWLSGILSVQAQDITNARLVSIGSVNILDTYLSPEKYSGYDIRYISHTTRENSTRWKRVIIHQGELAFADNRSGNGNEMAGMYNFQYGLHYSVGNWSAAGGTLTLDAGCHLDAHAGFIYNTRNANNPAQARAYLNITPAIAAAYKFMIRNHPFTLHYELGVPLVGVMFSPNYGQSYYEIFSQGNYDHNIVPTWPGNAPTMTQTLSIDVTLRRTTLRVGYLGDYVQAHVNNLNNHLYTHALMIGIVRKFQLIKKQP